MTVAAVQLWLAHRYFGFLTGDEVEVLGEAFRRARGFPYKPWEIRNLLVPDALLLRQAERKSLASFSHGPPRKTHYSPPLF